MPIKFYLETNKNKNTTKKKYSNSSLYIIKQICFHRYFVLKRDSIPSSTKKTVLRLKLLKFEPFTVENSS